MSTLHNTTPSFSCHDTAYGVLAHLKLRTYVFLKDTLLSQFSNLSDIFNCQFGKRMPFPKITPSFFNHVCHVIGTSPKKQMLWIYAGRVVACMKNTLSLWKISSIGYFPNKMMREDYTAPVPCPSVTVFVFAAWPEPTFGFHRDIIPCFQENILA